MQVDRHVRSECAHVKYTFELMSIDDYSRIINVLVQNFKKSIFQTILVTSDLI